MTGATPAAKSVTKRSTSSSRTPLWPRASALARSSNARRAMFGGSGAPVPAAWESRRFSCSVASCESSIRTLESFPNPVLIP
jgi:hypothetical protein